MSALTDGLDEARRGLWPSALESFCRAAAADPDDPAPALAEAVCALRRGDARRARATLDTSPALRAPGPPWEHRAAWLRAAALMALGDPEGATWSVRGLPEALRHRVEAAVKLQAGDYRGGVIALLEDRLPRRVTRGGP